MEKQIFTSNQGLGHNESVTFEVVRIEGDDVYGKYVSSVGIDEDDISFNIPFSLKLLIEEGNKISNPSFEDERVKILHELNEFKKKYYDFTGRVSPKNWRTTGNHLTSLALMEEQIKGFTEITPAEKEIHDKLTNS